MKFGIKTYKDPEFLQHFVDKADFFEVQAIQTENYSFIKRFPKIKVIHAEHMGFGTNIADKSKEKQNLKSIGFAQKLADESDSKKIIVHPGQLENNNCSLRQSINFLDKINDSRILIETMPLEKNRLCTTPEETKEFLEKTKTNLILDLNHSILTAVRLNRDYLGFLKEFIRLNPKHYHFGGQIIKDKEDLSHRSFKDSNIPAKKILSLLADESEITLEVTTDVKLNEYDLDYVRGIAEQI